MEDSYQKELDDFSSILSEPNRADPLPKVRSQLYLMNDLDKKIIDHTVQQ